MLPRATATQRRLEGDVYASHTQAPNSCQIWLQAQEAARSVRENAELLARAYSLGYIVASRRTPSHHVLF